MKEQLNATLKKLVSRAELIKKKKQDEIRAPRRSPLSEESQALVLNRSSRINGNDLPLWNGGAAPLNLQALSSALKDVAEACPPLSRDHQAQGATFKHALKERPERILYDASKLKPADVVQDVVTDCSFVAALEAMVSHDWRFGTSVSVSLILYDWNWS